MKKAAFLIAILVGSASLPELEAQTGIRPPRGLSIGLMGGAAAFSDMHRASTNVVRTTASGIESRELARRVGAETSTALGGYLSFWPGRNWGARIHATYAPTRFETLMRDSEAAFAASSGEETRRLAALNVFTADLQALFRLPTIKNRVLLYGIIGGGVARYEVASTDDPVPDEVEGEFEGGHEVRPGGMFGLGAMLPFRNRAFRLHFELTDHVSGTPVEKAEVQTSEDHVTMVNSVRFMVGVSWSPKH